MMKAAMTRAYGPPEVITLEDRPDPVPVKGEVLVAVTTAPVTAGDVRIRALDVPQGFGPLVRLIFGLRHPRRPVMGMEFAGRVEAPGPEAAGFRPGDRVFGITGMRGGAHAEKLTIRADGRILPVPDSLSDDEAAAFFFGGLTAMDFLVAKARLSRGQRLLINGATGAVGSAAVQIARHLGADVTALCSAANTGFALSLGAGRAADYRNGLPEGPFDVIMDCAGNLPYPRAAGLLAKGGVLLPVVVNSLAEQIGYGLRPRRGDGHRIAAGVTKDDRAAMLALLALHQAGAYRPVVGQTFAFSDIREAHALADTHHKRGAVILRMGG